MIRLGFWVAALVVAWTYVLFPILILVRGRVRPRSHLVAPIEPTVAVVVAARNEALSIGTKARDLLALDYPSEHLSACIVSDGSDDGTAAVARVAGGDRLLVLDLPPTGKAGALDAGVRATQSDVIVFTDANSRLRPSSIRALVRHFADATVGGVAGNQVYTSADAPVASETGERAYWGLDTALKAAESAAGNAVSATGALYAIRREHYSPIPPGVNDDFYLSLGVIEAGDRLVFDAQAVAEEPVAPSVDAEFARKVRVVTRAMRAIGRRRRLLDVRRYGFYSLQLLSHKVLRWAMPVPLAVLLMTSGMLARRGPLYALAAMGQVAAYAAALVGLAAPQSPIARSRIVSIPAYFCLVNAAAVRAAWNVATGRSIDRWVTARDPVGGTEGGRS
ncbi:MAG TPA: glycosyltransferase [Candidatus Limnocylindrales bacterium]|nr:glycosyltransferase [Candidatus Limnocylindrales bacterium]